MTKTSDECSSRTADLISFAELDWSPVGRIYKCEESTFVALVKAAGLDPLRDFRGANFFGLPLIGADLRGFDFTGADLRATSLRLAHVDSTTILDSAKLDDADKKALEKMLSAKGKVPGAKPSDAALLTLMATNEPSQSDEPKLPSAHGASPTQARRRAIRPTALIVDDDAHERELIGILLEETGLDVIPVASSEEAVKVLRVNARKIVLIVAAMNLPSFMDGARLAIYAQQWPWISVVVTSHEKDAVEPLPHPAVVMPKPWLPLNMLIQAERAMATGHHDLAGRVRKARPRSGSPVLASNSDHKNT